MACLSADQVLKSKGRRYKEVDVPELGGTVRIGSLAAARALEFRQLQQRLSKGEDVQTELVSSLLAGSCVDGDGKPLFTKETAREALEVVSVETMNLLVGEITALMAQHKEQQGNSPASPSAA